MFEDDGIELYSVGIIYASVCVPRGMQREVIERMANTKHPTGISSRWQISRDPTFATTGLPNPCTCETHANRMHYLLVC